MKAFINEYKYNLLILFVELIVGIFLFIHPTVLSSVIIISAGILLIVWGAFKIRKYFVVTLEKGNHIRGLSLGLLLITVGLFISLKSSVLQNTSASLMMVFGTTTLSLCFLKIELVVSMSRLKFGNVLWMSISFVFSFVVSILLFLQVPFLTSIPWILTGVVYIISCGIDIAALIIKAKTENAKGNANA